MGWQPLEGDREHCVTEESFRPLQTALLPTGDMVSPVTFGPKDRCTPVDMRMLLWQQSSGCGHCRSLFGSLELWAAVVCGTAPCAVPALPMSQRSTPPPVDGLQPKRHATLAHHLWCCQSTLVVIPLWLCILHAAVQPMTFLCFQSPPPSMALSRCIIQYQIQLIFIACRIRYRTVLRGPPVELHRSKR